MDFFLIDWIKEHGPWIGYVVLFLGACIEGETIVLLVSALAFYGYLSLPVVMLVAFSGTLIADQACFHIGKYYGPPLIDKAPRLKAKAERVFWWLNRYQTIFIMSFRFIYGIRIASPLIIGTSGISTKRFTFLNLPAAIVWAVISCGAGYTFARTIDTFIKNFSHYSKIAVAVIALVLIVVVIFRYWRKNNLHKNLPKDSQLD